MNCNQNRRNKALTKVINNNIANDIKVEAEGRCQILSVTYCCYIVNSVDSKGIIIDLRALFSKIKCWNEKNWNVGKKTLNLSIHVSKYKFWIFKVIQLRSTCNCNCMITDLKPLTMWYQMMLDASLKNQHWTLLLNYI